MSAVGYTPGTQKTVTLSGTMVSSSPTETTVAAGGLTIIGTVAEDQLVATFGADNAITAAFLAGIDGNLATDTSWDTAVKANLTHAHVTQDTAYQWTLTLPVNSIDIVATETVTVTMPADCFLASSSPIVASPALTVSLEGWRVNEPVGYTPGDINNFSDVNGEASGWAFTNRSGTYSTEADATAPQSPSNVGRATYASDFGGGQDPFALVINPIAGSYTKVYVCYAVQLSANWVGHTNSGVNKSLHFWNKSGGISGVNFVYISFQGIGDGDLRLQFRTTDGAENVPVSPTGVVSRGSWHIVELLIELNTLGNANGVLKGWVDNVLVVDNSTTEIIKNASHVFELSYLEWAPTWGGSGSTPGVEQTMAIDEIYWSVSA